MSSQSCIKGHGCSIWLDHCNEYIDHSCAHLSHVVYDCSQILDLLKQDIKPRDIMTRAAFENAMVIDMALGGSTNAVLHLLAMARACHVPLSLDDFQVSSLLALKTPLHISHRVPEKSQVDDNV